MLLCFCKTVDLCNLAIILPMGWLTTSHHHSAIGGAMARHCGLPFKCYNVGIAPKLVALPWCLRNLAVDSLVGMLLKRRRMSSRRPRDQSGPPGYQGGHWETTWQRRPKHKSTSHQARSNLISFSSIFRTYQLTKLGFSHFFYFGTFFSQLLHPHLLVALFDVLFVALFVPLLFFFFFFSGWTIIRSLPSILSDPASILWDKYKT